MSFPLLTLSIGAVRVNPGDYESHREVAAASATKKQSKREGKSIAGQPTTGHDFIERRRVGCGEIGRPAPLLN